MTLKYSASRRAQRSRLRHYSADEENQFNSAHPLVKQKLSL